MIRNNKNKISVYLYSIGLFIWSTFKFSSISYLAESN